MPWGLMFSAPDSVTLTYLSQRLRARSIAASCWSASRSLASLAFSSSVQWLTS